MKVPKVVETRHALSLFIFCCAQQGMLVIGRNEIVMKIKTDFLIIGSGVAGLSFALKVADYGSVALVTKKDVMDSNTKRAQGGIASVFGDMDSFDLHI